MIRALIRFALLAVVCIVIYNYFFGNESEKATSKRIFKGVGSVFTEVRGLVRSEKEKMADGKYDVALNKMQDVIEKLKSHATETNDANLQREVASLEQRKNTLEHQAQTPATDTGFQKAADKLKKASETAKQVETLMNDIQGLVNKVATPAEQ